MGATQRGTSIYLVEHFWLLDPLTQAATAADPSTVTFTVQDPDGVETVYEFGVATEVTNPQVGAYVLALPPGLPTGIWTYLVVGTGAVEAEDEHTFEILASGVLAPADSEVATFGPCQPWIDGDDVAAYDSSLGVGSATYLLDDVASMASQVLFEASGRQFPGICQRTVRPGPMECSCWGRTSLTSSWAWVYLGGGWGWLDGNGNRCGCGWVSEVRLAGYPVREILQVKIGGVALATTGEYRLDRRRNLVRLADPGPPVVQRAWPNCQNFALEDTEPGTFSVTYSWGQQPPMLGKMAAAALAAELYKAITLGLECKLPTSASRVVRQGITVERIVPTAKMIREGATGIQPIDVFLAMTNPTGKRRRSAVWTPDRQPFARKLGQ